MRTKILYCAISFFSVNLCSVSVDRLHIKLNRFDFDRVAAAKKYFEKRMSKTRGVVFGTLATGAALAGSAALYSWYQKDAHAFKLDEIQKKIDAIKNGTDERGAAYDNKTKESLLKQLNLELNILSQAHQRQQATPQNTAVDRFIATPLRVSFWGGMLLIALASGHQVFRVVSGTMEDALQLLWHGYDHWYIEYEAQLDRLMKQLREAFYQARKAAQQTGIEQQLLMARQQRRMQAMSSHDRLDIVTLYQQVISCLERVVALMFIVSAEEHHPLMQQHLTVIQSQVTRVAESLECDLNENSHGMLTHYSNNTLDFYHECVETIGIFISTYRTYLPVK